MAVVLTVLAGSLEPLGRHTEGSKKRVTVQVTGDTSYPTGGTAITAAQFGLSNLDTVNICGGISNVGSRLVSWNQTTGKLQWWSALTTEITNTTNLSADFIVVEAIGS